MPEQFRKFVDTAGGHRWSLKGANGEVVATSESYTRADDRDRSIVSVMRIIVNMAAENEETWTPVLEPDPDITPADHQAARQEFARRATDRDPDGPDEAA